MKTVVRVFGLRRDLRTRISITWHTVTHESDLQRDRKSGDWEPKHMVCRRTSENTCILRGRVPCNVCGSDGLCCILHCVLMCATKGRDRNRSMEWQRINFFFRCFFCSFAGSNETGNCEAKCSKVAIRKLIKWIAVNGDKFMIVNTDRVSCVLTQC